MGLARALTGLRDFHELLALAARGDNRNVDKTVGDIYGSGGCADLGMPADWTAVRPGASNPGPNSSPQPRLNPEPNPGPKPNPNPDP